MKVKELIKLLEEWPPNFLVCLSGESTNLGEGIEVDWPDEHYAIVVLKGED